MNRQRRKQIDQVIEELTELKARVEILMEEESEYLDNMPEGIQNSEKGEKAQESIDNIENAMSAIDEVIECLESSTT